MRITPLLALPLLVLAVACGSDSDTPVASGGSSTTTSTEAPSTTVPAGEACSTSALRITLTDQDLPPKVAATRKAIFDAAVACDYDALAALAGDDFSYTFGGPDDGPAAYWREAEGAGAEPMRHLALILNLPFAERHEVEGKPYRSWPSADQEHRTDADWDALRGLYDDETVDQFEAGDFYYGERTGIADDGTWMYFVAGD